MTTLEEQIKAADAEAERINAKSNALMRQEWPLREKAQKLRAKLILEKASHFLGRFTWQVIVRHKGFTLMAEGPRMGAFREEREAYETADQELGTVCAWEMHHDTFELTDKVDIRIDDGELKLQFANAEDAIAFMGAHKLEGTIDLSGLHKAVADKREQLEQAKADLTALEAVLATLIES